MGFRAKRYLNNAVHTSGVRHLLYKLFQGGVKISTGGNGVFCLQVHEHVLCRFGVIPKPTVSIISSFVALLFFVSNNVDLTGCIMSPDERSRLMPAVFLRAFLFGGLIMVLRKINITTIAKIGVLSAISAVLMLFEIPLWFAPSFYKIDLSELAVLIGGFALGPVAGIFIELTKVLLNFVLNGTITGGVGELSNFLIGCSLVVPASLVYRHKKTHKGAIVAMLIGIASMTIVGSLVNFFIILPFYSTTIMPMEAIINAGHVLNPYIVDLKTFVLFATTPFNLLKGVLVCGVTMLLYKRLSRILHK